MKTLYLIGGTMGVGKSTVCRSFWCFSGINGCSYALCEYL